MADFSQAHQILEANEGGYSNDGSDRGGETYKGISRKYFGDWQGWVLVDAAKPLKSGDRINNASLDELVRQFYKSNFWDKMFGDNIVSQAVANFIYDWFVNSGKAAITAVQTQAKVTVDGAMGMQTVNALNALAEVDTLKSLKEARIIFYKGIVAKDPSQDKFLAGWLARTEGLA